VTKYRFVHPTAMLGTKVYYKVTVITMEIWIFLQRELAM
jgi:hypothetical protein